MVVRLEAEDKHVPRGQVAMYHLMQRQLDHPVADLPRHLQLRRETESLLSVGQSDGKKAQQVGVTPQLLEDLDLPLELLPPPSESAAFDAEDRHVSAAAPRLLPPSAVDQLEGA
eukprot:109721-Hanusia_phi.AAC.4